MATAAAPCEQPGIQPCYGCVQAAAAATPAGGYCGCRTHYVPGQGMVVAYRCAYHGGHQEGGAEEWEWFDDPYEHHVAFDAAEYQPAFEYYPVVECRHWEVDDSNERIRRCLDRRKATVATKDACAKGSGWAGRWLMTTERSIMPAYVVLFTLIVFMLIAITVINILPSTEEGVSTETVAGGPSLTPPTARIADGTFPTPADNSSYATDLN